MIIKMQKECKAYWKYQIWLWDRRCSYLSKDRNWWRRNDPNLIFLVRKSN